MARAWRSAARWSRCWRTTSRPTARSPCPKCCATTWAAWPSSRSDMDYPSYDPKSPNTPLTEEELASLDDLLTNLPSDGSMTLDGMDGFLTALLVGPVAIGRTADWLPAVLGGEQE